MLTKASKYLAVTFFVGLVIGSVQPDIGLPDASFSPAVAEAPAAPVDPAVDLPQQVQPSVGGPRATESSSLESQPSGSVQTNTGLPDASSSPAIAEAPVQLNAPAVDSPQQVQPSVVGPRAAGSSVPEPAASNIVLWPFSPFSGPDRSGPALNFGVVEEGILYRSAQPTRENFRWYREQGIKGVVSFRRETGDDREYVLSQGFRNFLWLTIEDETPPTHEQAEVFLSFVTDSRNWPVIIFCKVGLGRTGTMAALVRYAIDGWSMNDALKESRIYRGGIDVVPGQIEFLRGWEKEHPPASHRFLLSDQHNTVPLQRVRAQ